MQNLAPNPSFEVDVSTGTFGYAGNSTITRSNEVAADIGSWMLKAVPLSLSDYGAYEHTVHLGAPPQNSIWRGRCSARSGGTASGKDVYAVMQEYGGATGNENGPARYHTMSSTYGRMSWSLRKVARTDRTQMQLYFIATADNAGDIIYLDDVQIHRLDTDPLAGVILGYNPVSYYMMDDMGDTASTDATGFSTPTHDSNVGRGLTPLHTANAANMGSMGFTNSLGNSMNAGTYHKFLGRVPFSACCWFRLGTFNAGSGHFMLSCMDYPNGWTMDIDGVNSFQFRRGGTGGASHLVYTHPTALSGQSIFCCIRYDGTNQHIDVNGVPDAATPQASTQSITSHTANCTVGAYSFGGSGMDGQIDEVVIFDYDIGGTASTAIYNAGMSTPVTDEAPYRHNVTPLRWR